MRVWLETSGGQVESSLRSRVRSFIVDNYLFGDESGVPGDDDSLIESGVIDSTGVLELIEFLEDAFGITVDESETVPQNLGSISGIVRFVQAKLHGAGRAVSDS